MGKQYRYQYPNRITALQLRSRQRGLPQNSGGQQLSLCLRDAPLALSWSSASGASSYRVERRAAGGSFVSLGTTTSTGYHDTSASSGSAYLYKVCAANYSGNCTSNYSNIALGAKLNFTTDPTIISMADDPTGATVTTAKAAHITELQTAINAVRSLAGQSAGSWTTTVTVGAVISVNDVRDLRSALHEALLALSIQTSDYTDNTIVGYSENPSTATTIKAVHIRELRTRSTSGTGNSTSGGGIGFTIHWMVTDQLGTPRMVFDQSGSLANVSRHDYLPFGEDLYAGCRATTPGFNVGDSTRQKFTGYEADSETQLNFAQARYQSPTQGRFTSPDPFGGSMTIADPQSFNRYAYVGNNPVNATDPSGLSGDGPGGSLPGAEGALGRLTGNNGVFETDWSGNASQHWMMPGGGSEPAVEPLEVTDQELFAGLEEMLAAAPQKPTDPTTITGQGSSECSISVSFQKGTFYEDEPSYPNGSGPTMYGDIGYGLGFTVSGAVRSGGIGNIGGLPEGVNPQNPQGSWTLEQYVSDDIKFNGTPLPGFSGGPAHKEELYRAPWKTVGNTFEWWDMPGTATKLIKTPSTYDRRGLCL